MCRFCRKVTNVTWTVPPVPFRTLPSCTMLTAREERKRIAKVAVAAREKKRSNAWWGRREPNSMARKPPGSPGSTLLTLLFSREQDLLSVLSARHLQLQEPLQ